MICIKGIHEEILAEIPLAKFRQMIRGGYALSVADLLIRFNEIQEYQMTGLVAFEKGDK